MGWSTRATERLAKSLSIGGLAIVLTVAGLAGHRAEAGTPPQRVLQAVDLDLGADGTLYGVKDTVVRKDQDGEVATDEDDVSPRRASGQLPVRVSTAYRTARSAGTDLADLKGYDGRVEVDVTVQNTTVRPQQLSYDSAGRTRTAYALVGAPMTVVASADLGKDRIERVVTSADSGAVTNGALSQDKDGHATVQWASLLAPPQLAPSTTFTLVMDAEDFSLPSLDISVQPGLAADPSIEGLLRNAFSDNGSSDLALQQQTIALISRVDDVLAASGKQLLDVRKQLDYSAGTLGDRTVADLRSGTSRISSSTRSLADALSRLGGSLGSALKQSQSQTLQTLDESVAKVQQTLGDPSAAPPTIPTSGAGCLAQAQGLRPAGSVYGQIAQVSGLLTALGGANGQCAKAIEQSLDRNLGVADAQGNVTCTTNDPSALCAIDRASTAVRETTGQLDQGLADARQALAGLGTGAAQQKLDTLIGDIVALQGEADSITGASDLSNLLTTIRTLLDGDSSGYRQILGSYDTLHARADQRLLALTGKDPDEPASTPAAQSAQASLAALDEAIAADTDTANNAELVRRAEELRTYVSGEVTAWTQVATATSPTSTAYRQVESFRAALERLRANVQSQVTDQQRVTTLKQDAAALYEQPTETVTDADGNPTTRPITLDPEACDATPQQRSQFDTPAAQVRLAFYDVQCSKQAVDAALGAANEKAKASVATAADGVHATIATVDDSRKKTDAELEELFGQASTGYARSAAQVLANGKAAVGRAGAELVGGRDRSAAALDDLVTGSLTTIDGSVSSSTRDLNGAADLLSRDLSNVLDDLGTRREKGSGLLGVVQAQSAQTRTSAARIARAGETASAFSNVRGQDVDGIFLRAAQLRASLARQAALAPFALTLPDGSRHTTVYSFHVREVK